MPAVQSLRHLAPLSPPETDQESYHTHHGASSFLGAGVELDGNAYAGHSLGATPERSRLQPRRTSTLSYQNSNARDLRDRSHARSSRNLVVVIPPPDFPLDQGQLGNVLSMGPRHRLSQGILMPLFPSMYSQLNAIAREYNFPSTVGLCLYFHITENGITMTPRISDDSWQYLFGHLFEARSPAGGHQLPIGGSIEFDIDLNKARWFDAWVSGTMRDIDPPIPLPAPSRSSSAHHWRGDSRTTNAEDQQAADERYDISGSQTLATNSRPATLRHLPKKLSLVDRLESQAQNVAPRSHILPDSPPMTQTAHALSPIPQSAIPQTAKAELERRVNWWRANAQLDPASMAEAYQPVPDSAVAVTMAVMDEYALEREIREEINLADYTWSVTSAGPPSPAPESPLSPYRLPSVHIDRRANGSVPLTPSTATSWGPPDEDWYSVVSSISRLPSPDLGERMIEDTEAPRRKAVWGTSFGWRFASTWQKVYPYAVEQAKSAVRVQLPSGGLTPQYPNLVIYPAAYPHLSIYPSLVLEDLKSFGRPTWGSSFGWQRQTTWRKVWPYSTETAPAPVPVRLLGSGKLGSNYPNLCIYPAAYPHFDIYPACGIAVNTLEPVSVVLKGSSGLVSHYPNLVIYPAAYPHFEIYPLAINAPNVMESSPVSIRLYGTGGLSSLYPNIVIYPAVYPNFDIYPACAIEENRWEPVTVTLKGLGGLVPHYPNLVTYPAAYPHLEIYPPATNGLKAKESGKATVRLYASDSILSVYPNVVIYPAVYPHLDLYPAAMIITDTILQKQLSAHLVNASGLASHYPNLVIYPAAYPNMDIYPTRESRKAKASNAVWGTSFGWQAAKTWLKVYPLNAADKSSAATYQEHSPSAAGSVAIWGSSFGWMQAKTWRGVWPLSHGQKGGVLDGVNLASEYPNMVIYRAAYPFFDIYPETQTDNAVVSKQFAVWGTSFGWENAATWRAVWPTSAGATKTKGVPSVKLPGSNGLSSAYPNLVIYPAAYPHFDIYPAVIMNAEVDAIEAAQVSQRVDLVPHYPNLKIYPTAYPHFDLYPPFAKAVIEAERSKGQSNLRRRRIEAWRAKTAAQVGLAALLANNHIWEADEPLELNLAEYAWSVTSAGPPSPPLDSPSSPDRLPSVHVERRMKGSVLLTPSTATSWGPLDDDWYSDVASIERLPSPDLGQRMLDDVENPEPLQVAVWPFVWPFFQASVRNSSSKESGIFVPEYPNLVIYPVAYPNFDIYPAWAKARALTNQNTEPLARINCYPVLDIYPAVYPHFNIYPSVDSQIKAPLETTAIVPSKQVQVTLAPTYPNFNLYPACYPYNLDYIYPGTTMPEEVDTSVKIPSAYPWLVIYQSVYPFVTPYPAFTAEISRPPKPAPQLPPTPVPAWRSFSVKLPTPYPTLDLYPAVYPWNLESIYPSVTVDDYFGISVQLPSRYPWLNIYSAVYPFVQPYPSVAGVSDSQTDLPGSLHSEEYEVAKGFLLLSKLKPIDSISLCNQYETMSLYPAAYPYFDLYPAPLIMEPYRGPIAQPGANNGWGTARLQATQTTRRQRRTHAELHASVSRSLEKRPVRPAKTHHQLHDDVFQDGVVWTPSGYMQDLTYLTEKKREETPREARRRPPPINEASTPRPLRSRSGTVTVRSPDNVVFPLGQPPPIPPLRVRSPGVPSPPSAAVSESPMPRTPPSNTPTRTAGSRLSQAVKSFMPVVQRRNSSAALKSPTAEEHKERAKDRQSPTRFLSLVDRRPAAVPPLPTSSPSEILNRTPHASQRRESLVLQRARAYEQSTVNQSPGSGGIKGTLSQFPLPPLPPIPTMPELAESIEKSKVTFA
ncbi:hypothetical protein HYDPIDRAFT_23631 [Hydnomerulius pinastri MD-312]|nr:hypothetical protein HYDPIDRAFT_23631 [Hydnomerulius pinastri MD-312]